MKKLFSCLLVLTMVLSLLAGCGREVPEAPEGPDVLTEAPGPQTEAAEPASPSAAVTVKTVDEFLAALRSDVTITLEPGIYDLTAASDYGQEGNGTYSWLPGEDGYELSLDGLARLTIRGSGRDTTSLVTTPRFSNVLRLDHCAEITLEDFTIGHTEGGMMCTGGVVRLDGCSQVTVSGMGLYGCGTIGVDLMECREVTVSQCDIYECSYAGIRAGSTENLVIEDSQLHDLREDMYDPSTAIQLDNCTSVTVTGCSITDNRMMSLLNFNFSDPVTVRNCTFSGNELVEAGFYFSDCRPIFDGCRIEDNQLRSWYAGQSDMAVDPSGRELTPEILDPALKAEKSAEPSADRTQVHAATVDEFLAAIAPNTEIILDAELYDLSQASGYGKGSTEFYQWTEEFDGPELQIQNVENLVITSSDGDVKAHTISAAPRYADVLSFRRCKDVTISGFTAGHTKEPGSCSGGVINFEDCDHMTVDNCGLFGCGIIGIQASHCSDIRAQNCDIYECSIGGIDMWNVQGATVDKTTFRDLGSEYGPGFEMNFSQCEDVLVDGQPYQPGF